MQLINSPKYDQHSVKCIWGQPKPGSTKLTNHKHTNTTTDRF